MKKKSLLFLLAFALFGLFDFINPTEVKALYNETLVETPIENAYYTRRGGGKPYMSAQYHTYTMNGKVVYCIEPGVDITLHSYVGYDGLVASPYSEATNKKIELIGHYGYDYPGHQTLRYRMATQSLIWEETGGQIVEFWTEASGWGDFINLNYERNEIMKLVNSHYNKPSFNGATINAVVGQEFKITDTNGLLSEYEIYNSNNFQVRIDGNNIYATPLTTGNLNLSVVRKHYDNNTTIVFHGTDGGSQKMGYFRFSDPVVASVNVNVVGGKVKINKVDSETNSCKAQGQATLVGAKYNIIDSNGNIVDTLTIGSDCSATSKNLPLGTYTIKEKSPSTGYQLDESTYTISVNSSDTFSVVVKENIIKSKIKINKGDSETNSCKAQGQATLVGAKYDITDHNGNVVDTLTIGDDCSATSKDLPYGNYYIKEKSAPTGYNIDSKTYSIFVNNSDIKTLTSIEDVIKGRIKINKIDSETNSCKAQGQATLVGAKFNILDHNGNIVDSLTIGDDCTAISKYLPYGNYKIVETNNPTGYYLNEEILEQFISNKNDYSITFKEDVIKNYISILKQYDYVNGNTTFLNAESNIVFEIFYPDGTKFDEIKTDKNGYATIEIPYGVWKFHQVNSNTGFEKIYDFYIMVDENSKIEQYYNILNNKISAYLQLFKKDSETGKTIKLSNIKFKILNTDTNQYVSQYVGGKVYDNFETDENGTFTTYLKLEAGNYRLVEIESPKGYVISKDGLNFTIGENTEYNYTTYGAFVVVDFYNTPIKGQLEIYKTGEKFNVENGSFNYTDISLKGIKYNIYAEEDIKSSDGNYIYYNKGDLVETLITDSNGYAKSKKLPLGKYYAIEVETLDNYVLDTKKHHFELTEKDNKTSIVYEVYKAHNKLEKGILEFTKTDLTTSKPLPNVKVEIYTESDELIFTGTTDKDGKIVIENLFVGKYYIIETETITGYKLSDEKVYFEILEDGKVVKATMTNEKIKGTLEFTKIDISNDQPLPNTTIEIYTESDELIFTGITYENGKIIIEELPYGKYYILEKNAPDSFTLNPEKMYFEILEDGKVVKATMTNEKIKGTLEFTKIDISNDQPLPNTTIEIYTESDELIFTGITDENGKIIIEDLPYGKYYILEKNAPDGYTLNPEKMYFEILEDGKVVKATMTNEKVKVPNTGLSNINWEQVGYITLIITGFGFIIYGIIKKKK